MSSKVRMVGVHFMELKQAPLLVFEIREIDACTGGDILAHADRDLTN